MSSIGGIKNDLCSLAFFHIPKKKIIIRKKYEKNTKKKKKSFYRSTYYVHSSILHFKN